jgi:hypothetical protein
MALVFVSHSMFDRVRRLQLRDADRPRPLHALRGARRDRHLAVCGGHLRLYCQLEAGGAGAEGLAKKITYVFENHLIFSPAFYTEHDHLIVCQDRLGTHNRERPQKDCIWCFSHFLRCL